MEAKQIRDIMEAYNSIYSTVEDEIEFNQEVEFAADYFYSEGLNEEGIDILIEELGIDEFIHFVYDIAEEYVLSEARAGGTRIEPVTKSGKSIGSLKGGAKTAAINRLRKEKAARKEAESKASASKQSGMTSALRSQAVKSAAAKQPAAKASKQGIGARIGAALKYAGERAKADTAKVAKAAGTAAGVVHGAAKVAHRAGQEFGKSEAGQKLKSGLAKTAKAAAGAAGAGAGSLAAGKSPAAAAGRAAGTFVRKLTKEECDYIVEYLINEKYAKNLQSAQNILENMSEKWIDVAMDIVELNRYEKETGKDYRTGKSVVKGGTMGGDDVQSKAMRHMHKVMGAGRMGAGGAIQPRGQKKVPGKKPPKAGEYGGPQSPAQKIATRRAAAQRAKDAMSSRFD